MAKDKDIIIVRRFRSDVTMTKWLENPKNVEKLKEDYSPKVYKGIMNLAKRQVEIHVR